MICSNMMEEQVVLVEEEEDGAGGQTQKASESAYEKVRCLVSGRAVVVFTISGCCMCHVVKQLLLGMGVGPTVVEIDRQECGRDIYSLLFRLSVDVEGQCRQPVVPAVFVGGRFLGGIDKVLGCHVNGSLVPLLKDAGALWL